MTDNELSECGLDAELQRTLESWGITRLTHIQKAGLEAGVADGESMIVCAPTSAGKTLVAEIAVFKALKHGKKCIYLVSHKALADQKFIDFENRFGGESTHPIASVGLSTGDHEEGEVGPRLLVATYEKALALLLSGELDPLKALVVADEMQITGEEGRGPNIDTLCSILRSKKIDQLAGLTATVGNSDEFAHWMECKIISSTQRDVELIQEIWHDGQSHRVSFGQEEGETTRIDLSFTNSPIDAVKSLIKMGRGPVLLFTESRNEALRFAEAFSKGQSRSADGIELAQQLDLFSEPTEASEQLQNNAQRKVAFHTADLTPQERQVVEQGFIDSKFDACFATSTLTAGVNFPFQSVVFPKLTYEWGARQGTHITRSDYRNMSGRAGRLGMHDQGYAILLPKNPRELSYANKLILPENDRVLSQLVSISMRRTILTLISAGVIREKSKIRAFFENTFYWYQINETNPAKLDDIVEKSNESIEWLSKNGFIHCDQDALVSTLLGSATAKSGLLPSTVNGFIDIFHKYKAKLENEFEKYVPALIHWVCSCDEFCGDHPSRFLPFPVGNHPVTSNDYLQSNPLFSVFDGTNRQVNQCSHAINLYIQGMPERQIRFQTNMSSGSVHRISLEVSWVLDGIQRIACVPEMQCPQTLTNRISMLSRRVRWGAPQEILDIMRVAETNGVPGFGRQRAMALLSQGISTFEQIVSTAKDKLVSILRNERRAKALVDAMSVSIGGRGDRYSSIHLAVATQLGLSAVVSECNNQLGTEYEDAIYRLLNEESRWSVTVLDDGRQQNVPDILIRQNDRCILVECKTTTKNPPLIKKEEAFAVIQKSLDYEPQFRRVTLGKPGFDEHSKLKVQASGDVTLVEHPVFIEGVLRVLAGTISPETFLDWIGNPGFAEIDRLSGSSTIEIAQK